MSWGAIALVVVAPFVLFAPLLSIARDAWGAKPSPDEAEGGALLFEAHYLPAPPPPLFLFLFGGAGAAIAILPLAALIGLVERSSHLRVRERTLVQSPVPSPGRAGTIHAEEVAGVAWLGYENVGIRLKSGHIQPVSFRGRIVPSEHEFAREAIVAFVERATGERLDAPPAAPPDVAPWMLRSAR